MVFIPILVLYDYYVQYSKFVLKNAILECQIVKKTFLSWFHFVSNCMVIYKIYLVTLFINTVTSMM